jgi:hypothetical protein
MQGDLTLSEAVDFNAAHQLVVYRFIFNLNAFSRNLNLKLPAGIFQFLFRDIQWFTPLMMIYRCSRAL